ncbi:MAG: hypothetical protein R3F33_10540 [Planctomycetota bacterium]
MPVPTHPYDGKDLAAIEAEVSAYQTLRPGSAHMDWLGKTQAVLTIRAPNGSSVGYSIYIVRICVVACEAAGMESVRIVAQSGGEIWNTLWLEFADQADPAQDVPVPTPPVWPAWVRSPLEEHLLHGAFFDRRRFDMMWEEFQSKSASSKPEAASHGGEGGEQAAQR